MESPFQANIVGLTTVPKKPRKVHKSQYSFLDALQQKLEKGQVIRLVIPEGKSFKTAIHYWGKICGKGNWHYRERRQEDGSYILWLWS